MKILLALLMTGTLAIAGELPATGETIEDFGSISPDGYQLMVHTAGHLNDDEFEDIAAVFELNHRDESRRLLVIALGREEGGYTNALENTNAILGADEGGIWGDPFDSIWIERKSLFIQFFGGSAWRWSNRYQFQFRKDGWYLIGYEGSYFHTASDEATETSINYLSGKMKKVDITAEGARSEEWVTFEKKPLVPLSTFDTEDSVTQVE